MAGLLALCLLGCGARGGSDPLAVVETLEGPNSSAAFATLDQATGAPVLEALIRGAESKNPRIRAKSVRLLKRKKDVTALGVLGRRLGDVDFAVRNEAAEAYVSMVDTPHVLDLLSAPETTSVSKSALVAALLQEEPAALNSKDFVDWTMTALDPPLRIEVYRKTRSTSLSSDAPSAGPDWARLLQRIKRDAIDPHSSEPLRRIALSTYAAYAGPASLSLTLPLLASPRPDLQQLALECFGWSRALPALEPLRVTAKNTKILVGTRQRAIEGLSHFGGNPVVRDELISLLSDPEEQIRFSALQNLTSFPDTVSIAAVEQLEETEMTATVCEQIPHTLRALRGKH